MEGLILRFDAPLMSFGGVKVDQHNVTDRFPGLSMLSGLVANALGWTHAHGARIQHLQARLVAASRWDVEPEAIVDYQTVDLEQSKMKEKGWTSRGVPEHRGGGQAAKLGIHQRYRHYWADGVLTSVTALADGESPDLEAIERALARPARPVFLGRKTCLPSAPILLGRTRGENVLTMLKEAPRAVRAFRPPGKDMAARWPAGLEDERPDQLKRVYDLRDWISQWHAGSRMVAEGFIEENELCS